MGRSKEPWHDDALEAVRVLKSGGVILHATDTVWGLACDATQDKAVERLNQIKSRHPHHPVLVLVADDGHVEELVSEVPEAAWDLMEHADRPVTVVYPQGRGVSKALLGTDGSLAVRRIVDPWCAFVIRGLGRPLASTSANPTGQSTPRCFREVDASLRLAVDFTSQHRQAETAGEGRPSMMVSFDAQGRFAILRS